MAARPGRDGPGGRTRDLPECPENLTKSKTPMKFAQMAKRLVLFVVVNLLVVTTISIVLGLLGVGRYMP